MAHSGFWQSNLARRSAPMKISLCTSFCLYLLFFLLSSSCITTLHTKEDSKNAISPDKQYQTLIFSNIYSDGTFHHFLIQAGSGSIPIKISFLSNSNIPSHLIKIIKEDKEGRKLVLRLEEENAAKRAITQHSLSFVPPSPEEIEKLNKNAYLPLSWLETGISFSIEQRAYCLRFWSSGKLLFSITNDALKPASDWKIILSLALDDKLKSYKAEKLTQQKYLLPVPINSFFNNTSREKIDNEWQLLQDQPTPKQDEIPFIYGMKMDGKDNWALKDACWIECKKDPSSYYEAYDSGPPFDNDPRMRILRIPNYSYSAVYMLGFSDIDSMKSPVISFRIGRFDGYGIFNDTTAYIPRWNEAPLNIQQTNTQIIKTFPLTFSNIISGAVTTGHIFLIRIPLNTPFPQDFEHLGDFLQMEITKELLLAVRKPDPCRFRIRPLGLPSGAHIFALTLEASPIQLCLKGEERGNIFNEPSLPTFKLTLTNITKNDRKIKISAKAIDTEEKIYVFDKELVVPPRRSIELPVNFNVPRGYYTLEVSLAENDNKLLTRRTTFALLPQDTRDKTANAPWGIWNFNGAHNTPTTDEVAPLMKKLGIRYSLKCPPEIYKKYGIIDNASPQAQNTNYLKNVKAYFENNPFAEKRVLFFHEHAISAAHVMRQVDCLLNRSPYLLSENEQKIFSNMWNNAIESARIIRKELPNVQILFGNGNPHLVEEFLRNKYPSELFDAVGIENCGFMRPPEAPPDNVSLITIWVFKQILDKYGYAEKPLDICYEWMCRSTAPGNLSEKQQANYYTRDILLALAWQMKHINPGSICDVGNSYYYSNWGAAGLLHRHPELNPKPSFVAYATLTLILDGTEFKKIHNTGSLSTFVLEFFKKPSAHIYACWSVKQKRNIQMRFPNPVTTTLIDWQARESVLNGSNSAISFDVDASPCYLIATSQLTSILLSNHSLLPSNTSFIISSMTNLNDWLIENQRNFELETYNFDVPRRKGDFEFAITSFTSEAVSALKILPIFPTDGIAFQPTYALLNITKSVAIPTNHSQLEIYAYGNSGWGRIIFEMEDAIGQRWISLGAAMDGNPTRWMADWLPTNELMKGTFLNIADWNANDSEALSYITFDGWGKISFPLPGQYPGEQYHFPRNCYWKYDKDGIAHYPLKFKKLIIEMREKIVYGTNFIAPTNQWILLKNLSSTK